MEEFWVVTFEGKVESYWIAKRDVVTAYIDSKPSESGQGRNSIEAHGKWKFESVHTFTSLEEKGIHEHAALRASGMQKLTVNEALALGLILEQEVEVL